MQMKGFGALAGKDLYLFETFTRQITPHLAALIDCPPQQAQVGIWKSRKKEIFHFAMNGDFRELSESVEGYMEVLSWLLIGGKNHPV